MFVKAWIYMIQYRTNIDALLQRNPAAKFLFQNKLYDHTTLCFVVHKHGNVCIATSPPY